MMDVSSGPDDEIMLTTAAVTLAVSAAAGSQLPVMTLGMM